MGTTCSTLLLLPEGALIAHVGDSRVYRDPQRPDRPALVRPQPGLGAGPAQPPDARAGRTSRPQERDHPQPGPRARRRGRHRGPAGRRARRRVPALLRRPLRPGRRPRDRRLRRRTSTPRTPAATWSTWPTSAAASTTSRSSSSGSAPGSSPTPTEDPAAARPEAGPDGAAPELASAISAELFKPQAVGRADGRRGAPYRTAECPIDREPDRSGSRADPRAQEQAIEQAWSLDWTLLAALRAPAGGGPGRRQSLGGAPQDRRDHQHARHRAAGSIARPWRPDPPLTPAIGPAALGCAHAGRPPPREGLGDCPRCHAPPDPHPATLCAARPSPPPRAPPARPADRPERRLLPGRPGSTSMPSMRARAAGFIYARDGHPERARSSPTSSPAGGGRGGADLRLGDGGRSRRRVLSLLGQGDHVAALRRGLRPHEWRWWPGQLPRWGIGHRDLRPGRRRGRPCRP